MKITRYFQSCLLVEEAGVRVLLDPSASDANNFDKFGMLDGVIYTHEHSDHFDPDLAERFATSGVKVYANASTAKQLKSPPAMVVTDGQKLDINGLSVRVKELPHCLMVDGSTSVQNTGYLLANRFFDPGDGVELEGFSAEIAAVPITGPDISLKDAYAFSTQLSAKVVIPVHYDFIGTKPDVFNLFAEMNKPGFVVRILNQGESAEV
jgi:L-ascorbate metabolism protein UlaG (beta-lactamase superfamily)